MNDDIKFLREHLKKLQRDHLMVDELTEADFLHYDPTVIYETSPDDERMARLADDHKLDGSIFRHVHTGELDTTAMARSMRKQIKMIPRIVAAIQQAGDVPHRVHPDADMLTVQDVATILNMGESTVRQRDEQGLVPKPIKIGGSMFWNRQELSDWVVAGNPPRQAWEQQKVRA